MATRKAERDTGIIVVTTTSNDLLEFVREIWIVKKIPFPVLIYDLLTVLVVGRLVDNLCSYDVTENGKQVGSLYYCVITDRS